jgi:hypothetical protein
MTQPLVPEHCSRNRSELSSEATRGRNGESVLEEMQQIDAGFSHRWPH